MDRDLIPITRMPLGQSLVESEHPLTALARECPDETLRAIVLQRDADRALALTQQKLAAMSSASAGLTNTATEWLRSRNDRESELRLDTSVTLSEGFLGLNKRKVRGFLRISTW